MLVIMQVLDINTWNHLIVCKQMSPGSFKICYLQTIRLQNIHIQYICMKHNSTLNDLQGFWYATKYNQPINKPADSIHCKELSPPSKGMS